MPTHPPTARATATRRHRAAARLAVASIIAGAGLVAAGATEAGTVTETDVMAWLGAANPSIIIDQTANCMPGATDAVAYRGDRLVVRSNASNGTIENRVNSVLNGLYSTTGADYVDTPNIRRITFPTPPTFGAIVPVVSVPLLPRPGAAAHLIVGASRQMRELHNLRTSPDYAYSPSGPYTHYWPNGYPEATTSPTRERLTTIPNSPNPVGTGVRVWITDTGVAPRGVGVLPNLSLLDPTIDDEQPNRVLNEGDADFADYPHAGHLLPISGSINATAPGVTMVGLRVNQRNGLLTDVDAADRIATALRTTPLVSLPSIIVMAFGTAACDAVLGGAPLPPIGTEAVAEMVDKYNSTRSRGMVIVASAGNVASTRRHYPAAFTNVIGVGALDATTDADGNSWTVTAKTAPVAEFSNTGTWVDVYAPGVEIAAEHVTNIRFQENEAKVNGAAIVSGTSFAAPIYAGYLAEQMSVSPTVKVRTLSTQLLNAGRAPLPKCGTNIAIPGRAVALGSFDGRITDPAVGNGSC